MRSFDVFVRDRLNKLLSHSLFADDIRSYGSYDVTVNIGVLETRWTGVVGLII